MSTKQAVRTELRRRLKDFTQDGVQRQSEEVTRRVLEHPKYLGAQRVGVYISMEDEIQTKYIITDIYSRGKACFVPRYEPRSSFMTMVHIPTIDDLYNLPRDNLYKIPQPHSDAPYDDAFKIKDALDLILVPGLGFTKEGKRIGRGKGFYDRFLASYSQSHLKPYTIGLALSEVILSDIPVSKNDYVLDEVIFEE